MIKLRYCTSRSYISDIKIPAQKQMKRLKISYSRCEGFPEDGCWIFHDCSGLPDKLPIYLKVVD